jgi:hypothetical protein
MLQSHPLGNGFTFRDVKRGVARDLACGGRIRHQIPRPSKDRDRLRSLLGSGGAWTETERSTKGLISFDILAPSGLRMAF